MANATSRHPRDFSDQQWNLIGRVLPELPRRKDGRGRPWQENRAVLNGILWILRTGAPWADLPARYPSYEACHRRFQRWVRAGVLRTVLEILAQALYDEDYLSLQEAFIDGSFAPAQAGRHVRGQGETRQGVEDCGDRIAENGRHGSETPYAPGQEFVAFLRWDPAANLFVRMGGPMYMFPVRDGRVEFRRTDAPGLSDGMPVDEFSRALRASLTAR